MDGMKILMILFKHMMSFYEEDINEAFYKSPNA